jgi:23S rRNA (pseudouridine1915-N3)-methyltransferase
MSCWPSNNKTCIIYCLVWVSFSCISMCRGFLSWQLPARKMVARPTIARALTTNILIVGKRNGGEAWIADGCAEYEKRLSSTMVVSTQFFKSDEELVRAAKLSKGKVFALDEHGKQLTSPDFSINLYEGFESGGAMVTFVIGGFAGLPDEIKKSYTLISLSKMTWTHQMARLLLLEQVYRAVEIRKGTAYHKA